LQTFTCHPSMLEQMKVGNGTLKNQGLWITTSVTVVHNEIKPRRNETKRSECNQSLEVKNQTKGRRWANESKANKTKQNTTEKNSHVPDGFFFLPNIETERKFQFKNLRRHSSY
jgi:hypothetical protein